MRTLNSNYRYLCGIAAICGLAVSGCSTARSTLWPTDSKAPQTSVATADSINREAPEVTAAFERLSGAQKIAYEPASFVSEAQNSPFTPVAEISVAEDDAAPTMPPGGWSPAEVISGPAWIPEAPLRR